MMLNVLARLWERPRESFAQCNVRREPFITRTMSDGPTNRPRWQIDQVLDDLMGADIRVEAKSFSPLPWTVGKQPRLLPVGQLILPDNTPAVGFPVFFEGQLLSFERRIGMVVVALESPSTRDGISEGLNFFRGRTSVILRGPAVVELAFPFRVERLPLDPENYWRDLRQPRAQFEFPFPETPRDQIHPAGVGLTDSSSVSSPGQRSAERCLAPVDLPPPNAVDGNNGANAAKGELCRSGPGPSQTTIYNLIYLPPTR